MEGTVLAVGWVLGGAVGLGTVVTGVLIGPSMQFWLRVVGASVPVADVVNVELQDRCEARCV
jgi:uncharacterized membrane protein YczE